MLTSMHVCFAARAQVGLKFQTFGNERTDRQTDGHRHIFMHPK